MVPQLLMEEIASLKKAGYQIQLNEVGERIYIIFKNYVLPKKMYNQKVTDLLVWTTTMYPYIAFDMFWTDKSLKLLGGKIPKAAATIQSFEGEDWRMFSIHPYNHIKWNAFEDGLTTYMTYIVQRLNLNL
ncbi:MAG: E2/UBC family protein [Flavobacteriaceae bacterium]